MKKGSSQADDLKTSALGRQPNVFVILSFIVNFLCVFEFVCFHFFLVFLRLDLSRG